MSNIMESNIRIFFQHKLETEIFVGQVRSVKLGEWKSLKMVNMCRLLSHRNHVQVLKNGEIDIRQWLKLIEGKMNEL